MITVEQVQAYLASIGVTLPPEMIGCLITTLEQLEPCFTENGYPECTQDLISLYLIGMIAISSGVGQIKSQTGPNGASRSFNYGDQWRQLRGMLAVLDPAGCTTPLQPADPNAKAALFIGLGSCVE